MGTFLLKEPRDSGLKAGRRNTCLVLLPLVRETVASGLPLRKVHLVPRSGVIFICSFCCQVAGLRELQSEPSGLRCVCPSHTSPCLQQAADSSCYPEPYSCPQSDRPRPRDRQGKKETVCTGVCKGSCKRLGVGRACGQKG